MLKNSRPYLHVFLVAFVLLFYQLLLTRIFSVIYFYHLAFLCVSMAMFGMTAGGLIHSLMNSKTKEQSFDRIVFGSMCLTGGSLALNVFFLTRPISSLSLNLLSTLSFFLVVSLPLVSGSLVVIAILSQKIKQFDKLYGFDLAGSAFACLIFFFALDIFDPYSCILFLSTICFLLAYQWSPKGSRGRRLAVTGFICAFSVAVVNTSFYMRSLSLLRSNVVKNSAEPTDRIQFEKWNAFSRLKVWGGGGFLERPFGWGLSDKLPPNIRAEQLHMDIDGSAYTVMTKFDGNVSKLDYLKFDITNFVHHLRKNASVYVIGVGGGRDILSALVFEQKKVTGVEINPDIFNLAARFSDFNGRLLQHPKVDLIAADGRQYLSRINKKFDIIMLSLVDTWAATASGGFALSENSLYTLEGFQLFLSRLNENGILSISRWFLEEQPKETARIVAMATKALASLGIVSPREHILVIKKEQIDSKYDVVSILISKDPFLLKDYETIASKNSEYGFVTVFDKNGSENKLFSDLTSLSKIDFAVEEYPFNIEPSTDDKPFFFIFEKSFLFSEVGEAGQVLKNLLYVASFLALIILLFPFLLNSKLLSGELNLLPKVLSQMYFFCIGMGFIFFELVLLNRLNPFLGHPALGYTVTLFGVLLFTGLGSLYIGTKKEGKRKWLLVTLALAVIVSFLLPNLHALSGNSVNVRIAYSLLICLVVATPLGFAMPIGLSVYCELQEKTTFWFWIVNGIASILGSIVATISMLYYGLTFSWNVGIVFYVFAGVLLFLSTSRFQRKIV